MLGTCPSLNELCHLLTDELAEAQEISIGTHVENCLLCQEVLERLTDIATGFSRSPSVNGDDPHHLDELEEFLCNLKSDPPPGIVVPHHPGQVNSSQGCHALVDVLSDRFAPYGYEVLGELGRGGMAIVYKARQLRLDRPVALKMVLRGAHATQDERDRFCREAEAIAKLDHPNIVQIYEIGEHEEQPFLALELVTGQSLSQFIHGSAQSARWSAELVETLARAIHAAHLVNIIHRDLKPANVLLTDSGVPKITDFGLAKRLDGQAALLTLAEEFLGTPSYMAPEQAVRKGTTAGSAAESATTPAVDIYGLGAILYELLTGRPPFWAETPLETVLQVLHEEPIPPTRLQAKTPRDLETICLKCLEKNPQRRYPTALELAQDLDRFLNYEPVKARPVSTLERGWRWCRRKTSLAIAVAIATIAGAAAIGLSISLAVEEHQAASEIRAALLEVESGRRRADRQAAHAAYEFGQTLCEKGEIAQGMLWLARGMKSARLARDDKLERAFNLNLSAWQPRIHTLQIRGDFPSSLNAAAYSPDGGMVAVAGDDSMARLFDTATGEPKGAPLAHSAKVNALAFDPFGKTLLTGCDDGVARLWDLDSGTVVGPEFHHQDALLAVRFSPDGRTVLTSSCDKTARLWSVKDGQPIGKPIVHQDLVTSVAFSPDGRTVLTGSWDRTARLWNATTGEPIGKPLMHHGWVSSVAFSPDGRRVLTGCYDRIARLWDTATGRPLGHPLRLEHCVRAVAISPDGKMILTGSFDGVARLWNTDTGSPIGPPLRHQNAIMSVAFSPDGRDILVAGFNQSALIYKIAKATDRSFSHQGFIRAVLFSPDGQTILTASLDHTARLWKAATGESIGTPLTHGDAVEAIAFSPDGRMALTGSFDNTARLWNAATGDPIGLPLRHNDKVKTVAFSPKGDTVLTGGGDKTARLWDVATGQLLGPPCQHQAWVEAVSFSPDGGLFVTGSIDKTARLWSTATRKPASGVLQHGGRVMAVAFSPDSRFLLTGSDDKQARLWDVATGQLCLPAIQHEGPVSVTAFSPDGKTAITGGWDGLARLWDVKTGLPIAPPLRHGGFLRALAISPDGQTVLTGSYDRTAQLWDKITGKPIGPAFRHENQVWFVAFSPDGQAVLSGGQENTAHLWKVPAQMDIPFDKVERRVQMETGMVLLDDGTLHVLNSSEWKALRTPLD